MSSVGVQYMPGTAGPSLQERLSNALVNFHLRYAKRNAGTLVQVCAL